jgi:transcriptional regulator with XRE-family HTH domain
MDDNSIGSQIKYWRKKRNMKQVELAEKAGIFPQNLSYYESGKRTVSMETLKKICEILRVDITLTTKQL